MRATLRAVLAALALAAGAAQAAVVTVTFDGDPALPGTVLDTPIYDGYGGFLWTTGTHAIAAASTQVSGSPLDTGTYPGSSFLAGAVSPHNVAYNVIPGSDTTATSATIRMQAAGTFDFLGAWFTSPSDWWLDYYPPPYGPASPTQTLALKGRLGGVDLWSGSVVVGRDAPTQLTAGWTGIDELVIESGPFIVWVMDDFAVALHPDPPPAAVPLPAALPLLAFGVFALGGIGAARRGRRA